MFWSKSTFFKQPNKQLVTKRNQVEKLLEFKGFEKIDVFIFLIAYDYFCINPTEFDGATIVKDLDDIKNLDLSAMVHDYKSIVELPKYSGSEWLSFKTKIDWQYGRNMELMGKGIYHYIRSIALILVTPIYWLIIKIK